MYKTNVFKSLRNKTEQIEVSAILGLHKNEKFFTTSTFHKISRNWNIKD